MTGPTVSPAALPEVLDAAYTRVKAAVADRERAVQVFDGRPVADLDCPDIVWLGLNAAAPDDSIEPARSEVGYSLATASEQMVISNELMSWDGTSDYQALRTQAFDLLRVVVAAFGLIREYVPGLWDVTLASYAYRPMQPEDTAAAGAAVLVPFDIRVAITRPATL